MLLRKKIAGLMALGASTLLPQTGLTLSATTHGLLRRPARMAGGEYPGSCMEQV